MASFRVGMIGYKALFGVPPMRDVQRLRGEAQDRAG